MITVYDKKQDCCGCTACQSICPTNAIAMWLDKEGFLYPSIQESLCTDCGICRSVCTFQNGYDTSRNLDTPRVYALKHKSDAVRYHSTSGGAFTAISDIILAQNGVVYGAGFTDGFHVAHQRAETTDARNALCGSKYVQSDLNSVFFQVKEDLSNDRQVLFTGTGCQVAGLYAYLRAAKVSIKNLLTIDIICRGTPSPKLFSDYIAFLEKKNKSKVTAFYFRSKVSGWQHTEEAVFGNGKRDHTSQLSQLFRKLIHSNMCLRPSCHQCRYTNTKRPGDITLGDFWGIGDYYPDFKDELGISLVIVNSEKGNELFSKLKNVEIQDSRLAECVKRQQSLSRPVEKNPKRQAFWADYTKHGFSHVVRKYTKYGSITTKIKRIIKQALKRFA